MVAGRKKVIRAAREVKVSIGQTMWHVLIKGILVCYASFNVKFNGVFKFAGTVKI